MLFKKLIPILATLFILSFMVSISTVTMSRADNYDEMGTMLPKNASDYIGGVNYPRVKIAVSADGTPPTDLSSANPLPVSLVGGAILSEVVPSAMTTILPTALPTAFSTPQFANSAALKSVTIDNSSVNQDTWCAFGGSTTLIIPIPAGGIYTNNLAAKGEKLSTGVACIHPGSTPSAGSVKIYGDS